MSRYDRQEREKPEPAVVEEPKPKFEAKAKRYIAKHPRTLILVGSATAPVRQPDNTFVMVPCQKPIRLVFKPVFWPTEDFAAQHGVTLEQLCTLIEAHSQFRDGEIRLLADGEKVKGKVEPAIVSGPRGTGAF